MTFHDAAHRNEGAVIKTMGDGAMLSFLQPICALKAILEIKKLLRSNPTTKNFKLRISVNIGKCIAIKFNSNIKKVL